MQNNVSSSVQANKRIEEETTQRRAVEKDLFNALNEVYDLQTQLGVSRPKMAE